MDILPLLDELQTIARNGLAFTSSPYDKERYQSLLELASDYYGQALDLPAEEVRRKLSAELGYITPKVGADAAIFDPVGRILLMLRADDGQWCLPCGWVDANESPAEAVVRETMEECGLDVRPVQLVDVFTRKPSATNGPHTAIALVYLCEVTGGTLTLSHEGSDLRYWHIDQVPAWHNIHRQYALAAHAVWKARLESLSAEE
ncbi:MAG: NUDIX domain-containing protein [bacterium]|nr:NUDIX domain-containing protein [bacterium]